MCFSGLNLPRCPFKRINSRFTRRKSSSSALTNIFGMVRVEPRGDGKEQIKQKHKTVSTKDKSNNQSEGTAEQTFKAHNTQKHKSLRSFPIKVFSSNRVGDRVSRSHPSRRLRLIDLLPLYVVAVEEAQSVGSNSSLTAGTLSASTVKVMKCKTGSNIHLTRHHSNILKKYFSHKNLVGRTKEKLFATLRGSSIVVEGWGDLLHFQPPVWSSHRSHSSFHRQYASIPISWEEFFVVSLV